jgi:hypothetical protein
MNASEEASSLALAKEDMLRPSPSGVGFGRRRSEGFARRSAWRGATDVSPWGLHPPVCLARRSRNQKNRNFRKAYPEPFGHAQDKLRRRDAKAAKKKKQYFLSERGVLRALAGGISESEIFHVSEICAVTRESISMDKESVFSLTRKPVLLQDCFIILLPAIGASAFF